MRRLISGLAVLAIVGYFAKSPGKAGDLGDTIGDLIVGTFTAIINFVTGILP